MENSTRIIYLLKLDISIRGKMRFPITMSLHDLIFLISNRSFIINCLLLLRNTFKAYSKELYGTRPNYNALNTTEKHFSNANGLHDYKHSHIISKFLDSFHRKITNRTVSP